MRTSPRHLLDRRLRNQRLARPTASTPAEVVTWLGAVQAQEYAGAKWTLGQRARAVTDADVDAAFDRGAILRTHILRPTWHFVAAADLRWMLSISAPRVHASNGFMYRSLELDPALLARSRVAFERALGGGAALTRTELQTALKTAGITAAGPRLAYIVMHAELEQVICSGGRRGRQFTYGLLDERAPRGRRLGAEEALAELACRYFTSRGPATIRDFVWWSGLTVRQAKLGVEAAGPAIVDVLAGDVRYWLAPERTPASVRAPRALLLPTYDEFLIAYKDRELAAPVSEARSGLASYAQHLMIDGRLAGSWRRTLSARGVHLDVRTYAATARENRQSIEAAVDRYGSYLGLPSTVAIES